MHGLRQGFYFFFFCYYWTDGVAIIRVVHAWIQIIVNRVPWIFFNGMITFNFLLICGLGEGNGIYPVKPICLSILACCWVKMLTN